MTDVSPIIVVSSHRTDSVAARRGSKEATEQLMAHHVAQLAHHHSELF